MAVPASGSISMLGLAREKVYDNYSSTSTPTGPYSIYDLVNGGSTNGSGTSFDTTNTNSASYPNTTTPHAMSEWRSYDHDYTAVTMTLYVDDYIFSSNSYVRVVYNSSVYEALNGANESFTISVPANTSITLEGYAEDVANSSYNPTIEFYDDGSFSAYNTSTGQAYVSASYTTPSSNFNMYAVGY